MENQLKKVNFFNSPVKILGGVILLVEAILTLILKNGKLNDNQQTWIIVGMIVVLILAVIGSVIMHWIDNKSKWNTITSESEKEYEYDIFISFPIAGIEDKNERAKINKFVNELEKELKNIGYTKIFNASLHFSHSHDHQPPQIACETDFKALDNSKNFLFIYSEKIATSTLIELGYALGGRKRILMCSKSIHTLPFLARGLEGAYQNVNFIEYKDEKHLIDMLIEHNKKYFN